MAKSSGPRTEFRTRPWVRAVMLAGLGFFLTGLVVSDRQDAPLWQVATFAALSLVAVLGLLETWIVRVSLRDDSALIVSLKGRRRLPRELIETVKWEGGSGVALRLRDGTWIQLPEMYYNSQGLANSIRAWLRRTEPRGAEGSADRTSDTARPDRKGSR